MGVRVPKSLSDYPRFGADLAVICKACGRIAIFDAAATTMYLYSRRKPTSLPVDTSLFKCKCGSRNLVTEAFPIAGRPSPLPIVGLLPLYIRAPGWGREK